MEIISNGIKASRPPAYRCDPSKAIGCPGTSCYLRGGPCYSTINVSDALLDEYGKPILSDIYMDILLSKPYKKQKFDREDIIMDSNEEEQ
jgi:hypothetical protein